jgi:uncharacterized sulfatase
VALGIALLWAACAGCSGAPEPPERPNLVVIISDDHGYTDFGFMGSRIVETPRIDRLAEGGTVFSTGYTTSSVCRPSLLSLLTGLHPYQFERQIELLAEAGTKRHSYTRIQDFATLPRYLEAAGYTSFQVGKHWEGFFGAAGFTRGTKTRKVLGSQIEQHSGGWEGLQVGRSTMEPIYDFIYANEREPFLIWFCPLLPHAPFDAPARFYERYADVELTRSALHYYANVARLDDAVGALVDFLDQRRLREQTLIVFLADNGWHNGPNEEFVYGDAPVAGSAFGGPRGKGSMHELGFRTPIIFNWPGQIPAGVVREDLVSTVDLLPTLVDFAGLPPPERPGRSLRAAVLEGAALPARSVIGHMPNDMRSRPNVKAEFRERFQDPEAFFLRNDTWHYIWYRVDERDELYRMLDDPAEQSDVSARHPELVAQFQAQIERWEERMANARPLWRQDRPTRPGSQRPKPAGS